MRYLRQFREVVDLETLVKAPPADGPPAVAVTFDDGYRSVVREAVPGPHPLGDSRGRYSSRRSESATRIDGIACHARPSSPRNSAEASGSAADRLASGAAAGALRRRKETAAARELAEVELEVCTVKRGQVEEGLGPRMSCRAPAAA
jgi:hypothetical protein